MAVKRRGGTQLTKASAARSNLESRSQSGVLRATFADVLLVKKP